MRQAIYGIICAMGMAGTAQADGNKITIAISFDEATIAKLTSLGEWVTVSAYYSGDPAREDAPTDEMGMVYLGHEEAQIYPKNQTVELGGFLAGAPLDWVAAPLINVNVYSARFVDENNILNCGIVDGPVGEFSGTVQTISCTLLGG
jgi:hypothetical protein